MKSNPKSLSADKSQEEATRRPNRHQFKVLRNPKKGASSFLMLKPGGVHAHTRTLIPSADCVGKNNNLKE